MKIDMIAKTNKVCKNDQFSKKNIVFHNKHSFEFVVMQKRKTVGRLIRTKQLHYEAKLCTGWALNCVSVRSWIPETSF